MKINKVNESFTYFGNFSKLIQKAEKIKETFNAGCVKHTALRNKKIKKVALCGGAGASFAGAALSNGADIYLTGEARYHELFDNTDKMLYAIIGHYESEQYTVELLERLLSDEFPHLPLYKTEVNTNPIHYLV